MGDGAQFNNFIYLLDEYLLSPLRGWRAPTPRKEEQASEKSEEKGTEVRRVKPLAPTRAIDELIGGEELREKEGRTTKRKKQGEGL